MKLTIYLKKERVTQLISVRFEGKSSIKRFSLKLGVTQAYVYNMLNQKSSPSSDMRHRIGRLLGGRGVNWDDIFHMIESTTGSYA